MSTSEDLARMVRQGQVTYFTGTRPTKVVVGPPTEGLVTVPLVETVRRYNEAHAKANAIAREVAETHAAFRRAVIEDFANCVTAYLVWCDAMHKSNQGGREHFTDIPHFPEAIDLVLYQEAINRRKDQS